MATCLFYFFVYFCVILLLVSHSSCDGVLRPPILPPPSAYGPFDSNPYFLQATINSRLTQNNSNTNANNLINAKINFAPALFSGLVLNSSALSSPQGVELVLPLAGADITLCSPIAAQQQYVGKVLMVMYTGCPPQIAHLGVAGILMYGCPLCAPGLVAVVVGGTSATGGNGDVTFPVLYISNHDGAVLSTYISTVTNNNVVVSLSVAGSGPLDPTEKAAIIRMTQTNAFPPFLAPIFYPAAIPWSSPVLLSADYDPCTSATPLVGIWCEFGHVVFLDLSAFGVTGTFFSNIDQLRQVRAISGVLNQFTGPLPSSLCSLTSLMVIEINNQGLTSLPDCIQSWTNIVQIVLNNNQINHVPNGLAQLTTLTTLDLSSNVISSFPSFSGLKSLNMIDVSNNNATATISSFNSISGLTSLSLANNQFSGCIESSFFDNLPLLTKIDLSNNQICGPLPNFIGAAALQTINIQSNQFSGPIPPSWSQLSSLLTLSASNNSISWPVTPLSLTKQLTSISLAYNNISNPSSLHVDAALRQFGPQSLTTLVLDGNKLNGIWDGAELYNVLINLVHLSIAHNEITSIPDNLFTAEFNPPFTYLDLSYNMINCSFPSSLPSSSLSFLSLLGNPISVSSLPSWLGLSSTFVVASSVNAGANAGDQAYSCPSVYALSNNALVLKLDPAFNQYKGCKCSNGYYGQAPNCLIIPSSVVPAVTSAYVIDDSQFGGQRFTSGMDTTWTIGLSPDSLAANLSLPVRVVTCTVILFPSFNSSSNTLSISLGGLSAAQRTSSVDALVAQMTSMTASAKNQTVRVFDNAATINFKSRDTTDATHFKIYYEIAFDCPPGYEFADVVQQCYPVFVPSSSYSYAVFAMAGVVVLFLAFTLILVVMYSKTTVIMASSFPFCLLTLFFLNVLAVGSIFFAIEPSSASFPSLSSLSSISGPYICHMRPWFTSVGVVGLMASMLVKTSRIKMIFIRQSLNKRISTNEELIGVVCILLVLQVILLVVYSSLPFSSPLSSLGTGTTSGLLVHHCSQPTDDKGYMTWIVLQFIYVAFFLFGSIQLAFSVRNVPSSFNESSHIVNCFIVLLSLGTIIVIIQFVVSDDPNALTIIRGFGQAIVALLLALAIFGPKIYIIFEGRANEIAQTHTPSLATIKPRKGSVGSRPSDKDKEGAVRHGTHMRRSSKSGGGRDPFRANLSLQANSVSNNNNNINSPVNKSNSGNRESSSPVSVPRVHVKLMDTSDVSLDPDAIAAVTALASAESELLALGGTRDPDVARNTTGNRDEVRVHLN